VSAAERSSSFAATIVRHGAVIEQAFPILARLPSELATELDLKDKARLTRRLCRV
jgi:hypothetical protein